MPKKFPVKESSWVHKCKQCGVVFHGRDNDQKFHKEGCEPVYEDGSQYDDMFDGWWL